MVPFDIKCEKKGSNFIYLTSSELLNKSSILIAFSKRHGGKSKSPYDSLNLALHVGDKEEVVIENREILCSNLVIDMHRLTTCEQVHGSNVVVVDESLVGRGSLFQQEAILQTDALITNIKDVPLAVFCADCVPILIVDPVKRVVGVVHAGWRGTYAEISRRVVQRFVDKFGSSPKNILSFIGPHIRDCCYRVGQLFAQKFEDKFPLKLDTHPGESYLNLEEANIKQLIKSGVQPGNINSAHSCTSCNPNFFSYRRDKGVTGRQCALVVIK
ncbi:MAG TPA: peptidoglycan editing factor PgeF [Actinobacteria bacterium]|nr:peptidoglycan editing factor PgeF [Actinomycetota bacterium]